MAREKFILRHMKDGKVLTSIVVSKKLFERMWTMARTRHGQTVDGQILEADSPEALAELVKNKTAVQVPPTPGETSNPRGQMKVCPKCGKLFKAGGLAGHLFYVHKLKDNELKEQMSIADVDQFSRAQEVLALMKQFNGIEDQRRELEKTKSKMKEEMYEQLCNSLDQAEEYLRERLEEEGVFLTEEAEDESTQDKSNPKLFPREKPQPRLSFLKQPSDEITDAFIKEWESKNNFLGLVGINLRRARDQGWTRAIAGQEFNPVRFTYREEGGEWFKLLKADAPPLPPDPKQITDEQIRLSRSTWSSTSGKGGKILDKMRSEGFTNVLQGEVPDKEEFEVRELEGKLYKRPR